MATLPHLVGSMARQRLVVGSVVQFDGVHSGPRCAFGLPPLSDEMTIGTWILVF